MTPQVDSLPLFSLEQFALRISVTSGVVKDKLTLPDNDLLDSSTRMRLDKPLGEQDGWLAIGAVAKKRAETWALQNRLGSSYLDTIYLIKKIIDFSSLLSPAV